MERWRAPALRVPPSWKNDLAVARPPRDGIRFVVPSHGLAGPSRSRGQLPSRRSRPLMRLLLEPHGGHDRRRSWGRLRTGFGGPARRLPQRSRGPASWFFVTGQPESGGNQSSDVGPILGCPKPYRACSIFITRARWGRHNGELACSAPTAGPRWCPPICADRRQP